jgi:hypothetical protein
MKVRIYIVVAAALSLAACGTPGAPRPPSLRLPETVRDLAASRQGNTVTLTWTESQRTTDGENIRALGPTLVCMGGNDFPMTHCAQVAADLSQSQYAQCAPKVGQPASCQVTLALELQGKYPLGQATYALEVLNTNGRSAGLSNQVRVAMVPTLPPPDNVTAKVTADAIVISATGVQRFGPPQGASIDFHLYRREPGSRSEVDLGTDHVLIAAGGGYILQFLDRSFEWGKTYLYCVSAVTAVALPGETATILGDYSPEVQVTAKDTFPPAAPVGVQAVASGVGQQPFIDLTWAPNTESDLAGYNVYRHEEGQPAVKINAELAKAPSYRDANVQRGKKYFYSVSAVDLRGNESAKSSATSENVQ